MKILVTGVNGQLGHDVFNEAVNRGHEVIGSDISNTYSGLIDERSFIKMDITDKSAVYGSFHDIKPDAIIHCAAWTAVDAAEDLENRNKVFSVNTLGTKYIAEAVKSVDAKMMYISTDYVFDGKGQEAWKPEEKRFNPLNYYGRTKLDGEKAVFSLLDKFFVVRIAWVFGLRGNNFIKTMINIGKTHDTVRVVNDQIGTPTYTVDLARLLIDMIETDKYGYYHVTNSESEENEYISWYDFCCEIYRQYGLDTNVIPVSTEEYSMSKATRPFNSRLDKSKLLEKGFTPLPTWQNAIGRYLKEAEL